MVKDEDEQIPTPDTVKYQVRHNPLYKPKVVPDKRKKNSKEQARKPIDTRKETE